MSKIQEEDEEVTFELALHSVSACFSSSEWIDTSFSSFHLTWVSSTVDIICAIYGRAIVLKDHVPPS